MAFVKRIARIVLVIWGVSLLTFLLSQLTPGDPARTVLGNDASEADLERVRGELGLDKPIVTRYLSWLWGVLRLDFGNTLKPPVRDVGEIYLQAAPATIQIVLIATIIAVLIGIPMGAISAYREGKAFDRISNVVTFSLIATPPFVMGLLLIIIFVFHVKVAGIILASLSILIAVVLLLSKVKWRPFKFKLPGLPLTITAIILLLAAALFYNMTPFPRYGWVPISEDFVESLRTAFLPALTLTLGAIPLYGQMLRTDMIRTLNQNFVTVAWAKGMPTSKIITQEALRPSLFSVTTIIGLGFGNMIGGTVIVETIFGIPGIGRVLVEAIIMKDFPVIQAGVLIVAVIFVAINVLVDISYPLIDPRVRNAK